MAEDAHGAPGVQEPRYAVKFCARLWIKSSSGGDEVGSRLRLHNAISILAYGPAFFRSTRKQAMSKLKGFMSKLNGFTLVFTLMGTSLFTFVAVSQRSEASETFPSNKFVSGQGASPAHNPLAHDQGGVAPPRSAGELQQSSKPIVTVQSLPSAEPQVPSEVRVEAPATAVIPSVS